MKKLTSRLLAPMALAFAASFGSPSAFAQGTFTAASSGDVCNPGGSTYAQVSCGPLGAANISVTLQAWGFTGNTLGSSLQTGFQRGSLGDFNSSGFGAYTGTKDSYVYGQHGFDNITSGCGTTSAPTVSSVTLSGANSGCGGSIEALFLDFGTSKVNLTSVDIGWMGADADLSVWAWTGAGTADMASTQAKGSTTTSGTTAAALTGWTLVSDINFDSVLGGDSGKATNGSLYSSYFLITTYFGASSSNSTGVLSAGNDKFKLDAFTVGVCGSGNVLTGGTSGTGAGGGNGATCEPGGGGGGSVPEPGSLALAGLALAGVFASRRKVKALF